MSIRVNNDLSLKDRKVYTFENFRGVDFSTSPYKVAQNRAISAKNLIYKDGLVRKRNGWKSLLKFDNRINGVFSFEINNESFILVYSGTSFYLLSYDETIKRYTSTDITNSCTYNPAKISQSKLIDRRIQLYVSKNKAYIVGCGDYLVFGKWDNNYELRRVCDNVDTYIPTTTINIDNDSVNDTQRASLDDVNLLSSYRINEMVGVDNESATWTVDTAINGTQAIDEESDITIVLYTLDSDNQNITKTIKNRISSDKTLLYTEDDDVNSVGSVDFAKGKITLNINTKPQETDSSNIIVTFKKSNISQAKLIEEATISTVFGGGGNSNRLFVGGNQSSKNVHLWSEMYDFTYFSDNNYDEIGSDSSAIVGYVRATDGFLLVFKEKNGSDATIYYVSGTDTEETDINGDKVFVTVFNKYAGNVTDTILGKYATASLNGDNLILTNNGVKGLQLFDNLTTNAYRVQERSRNINNKLLKEQNLSEACAIVYKDKYYLAVNENVYVCDSAFTFQTEADISDGYNYEWWFFDNINARVWCEIDNQLYFGTNDGKICVVTEDFADITYQYIGINNITISGSTDKVAYNVELDDVLNENDTIEFVNSDLFALYLEENTLSSVDNAGNISFGEDLLAKIYNGIEVYADEVDDTGLEANVKYIIKNVDLDNLTFNLCNDDGEVVIPTQVSFRLCKKITNKELYITNIDSTNNEFSVREFLRGETLDLVWYNNQVPTQLCAYLCFKKNVVAVWCSPIYDLGSNMYSKTLLGMTVATEPLMKGAIQVGYQTRNIEKYFTTQGNRSFDFDDIDFENFSFEGSFTNSNTVKRKERNFNFIMLRYVSDNQYACAVSGITIRYKINRLNKGVR